MLKEIHPKYRYTFTKVLYILVFLQETFSDYLITTMNSSNMSTKLNVIKYNHSGEFITESLVSTITSINT
jgi:hypothetical protein